MTAPVALGRAAVVRRRLSGVLFLGVLAALVGLTVALYTKAFTPVVRVTLQTDRAGNQLSELADVKIRGLVVGTVREIRATDSGAELELAIERDEARLVPSDVRARLLPKTLFGEKYVELVLPEGTSGAAPIRAGDVIPQDRSEVALETARVVDNLLPLLQTLQPAALSTTLNALSGALRGKGERLGANLDALGTYLAELNPALPTLERDLQGLADLAGTFDQAAPDLLDLIEDLSVNARTLVDQRDELAGFLGATEAFADEAEALLRDNDDRLVTLARDSLPVLQTFARYSPEFPCLLGGLRRFDPIVSDSFGGLQRGLHITLEVVSDNNGYTTEDTPEFLDDSGPLCLGLPDDVPVPNPDAELRDGYRDEERAGIGGAGGAGAAVRAADDPARALSGADAERSLLSIVTGPVLGLPSEEVPDIVTLLFGPAARGTQVVVS